MKLFRQFCKLVFLKFKKEFRCFSLIFKERLETGVMFSLLKIKFIRLNFVNNLELIYLHIVLMLVKLNCMIAMLMLLFWMKNGPEAVAFLICKIRTLRANTLGVCRDV